MNDNIYYIIIIAITLLFFWLLINRNYFRINKIIKKTRCDVDNCIKDVEKLKVDMKRFNDVVIAIDERISQIEKKVK